VEIIRTGIGRGMDVVESTKSVYGLILGMIYPTLFICLVDCMCREKSRVPITKLLPLTSMHSEIGSLLISELPIPAESGICIILSFLAQNKLPFSRHSPL